MSDVRPARGLAPSLDDLAALAEAAFAALPAGFRRMTGDVTFRVEDFADAEVLEALEIENAFELTGLYQGVDIGHRSVFDAQPQLSLIFLYRRPILDEWAERGDVTLEELVAHVLVHEIGHHFGLSDDDIAAVEAS
ncbi:metallopeptidase family protein [Phenylobacterium sp.]|jgi:predicted Zn-dependent protease with MMP-like domain|uniref:metallopeptidase family protein n=1 Tax=Phenylobacterium sp. TaxID=1871053 RepID=UPI002F3ECFE8